jgi:hypothetical protein
MIIGQAATITVPAGVAVPWRAASIQCEMPNTRPNSSSTRPSGSSIEASDILRR